jgi:hypothetical protein
MTSKTKDLKPSAVSRKLAYIRTFLNLLIADEQAEKRLHTKVM